MSIIATFYSTQGFYQNKHFSNTLVKYSISVCCEECCAFRYLYLCFYIYSASVFHLLPFDRDYHCCADCGKICVCIAWFAFCSSQNFSRIACLCLNSEGWYGCIWEEVFISTFNFLLVCVGCTWYFISHVTSWFSYWFIMLLFGTVLLDLSSAVEE